MTIIPTDALVLNVVAFVLAVFAVSFFEFILRRHRVRRGNDPLRDIKTYPKYLPRWAMAHFRILIICVPVLLFTRVGIWLAPALLVFAAVRRLLWLKERRKEPSRKQMAKDQPTANTAWLAKLGSDHSERVQAIDAIFEEKTATLEVTRYAESGPGSMANYVSYTVSRSLAAMDNREREYLRIAELLNSAAGGNEEHFIAWRAALIWGDGKGVAQNSWWGGTFGGGGQTTIATAITHVEGLTVDQAVNAIQKFREDVTNSSSGSPKYRAVFDEAKDRIAPTGGGAWLKSAQIAGTAFASNGDFALHIGSFPDGTPLTYSGEGSMVTIAPPGSGKTQCNVFPNLLTWRGPAVVLDISGDIYEHTAAWREANVGPVYKFSPLEPEDSHKYNPLTFVRREPDYIWEDARLLAEMMIVPSLTSDPFWENEARTVLTAAIAYVCYSNPPEERPMHAVLDVLFGGPAWEQMILGLRMAIDVRVMTQHATSLSSMNEKTLSSVLQTARSSLGAWSGERVARATASSDWSPMDLRDGSNPTIYIYIRPNEVEAYLSLLRVFIGQHIRVLTGGAVPPRGAPPILVMLDELPRLRYMAPVDEALNIGRKYGLRLWLFAQSVGQMKTAYENADGMLGSCAVRIFMNPSGADGLAERLSEEIGYVDSLNDNSRKRMVEAAELAGPKYMDQQIVLGVGAKPVIVSKDFAWRDPELMGRMSAESLATRA